MLYVANSTELLLAADDGIVLPSTPGRKSCLQYRFYDRLTNPMDHPYLHCPHPTPHPLLTSSSLPRIGLLDNTAGI